MEVTVLYNQSLLDIAVQELGTATAVFDLALANEMELTDKLIAGQILLLPHNAPMDREVATYYRKRKIRPATAQPLIVDDDLQTWFGSLPGMLPLLMS